MFEVKGGSVSRRVKNRGSADALFAPDGHLDRALRQLSRVVQHVRLGYLDAPGRELSKFVRVIPCIVSYEQYLQSLFFRERLDAEAASKGLAAADGVSRVALLDFDDVEHLTAVGEAGHSITGMLWQWL